jgi:hypothetical protein
MGFDAAHHRLFLACGNKLMVMMNSATGKVITTVPIGDRPDGCEFDPGTQLAFASCGDGTTTIAHEDVPDKLTVVQTLKTERRARRPPKGRVNAQRSFPVVSRFLCTKWRRALAYKSTV